MKALHQKVLSMVEALQHKEKLLQPEIEMPLVSSLVARKITDEDSVSKGIVHGGGFATWK